jgi:hypothetical protein
MKSAGNAYVNDRETLRFGLEKRRSIPVRAEQRTGIDHACPIDPFVTKAMGVTVKEVVDSFVDGLVQQSWQVAMREGDRLRIDLQPTHRVIDGHADELGVSSESIGVVITIAEDDARLVSDELVDDRLGLDVAQVDEHGGAGIDERANRNRRRLRAAVRVREDSDPRRRHVGIPMP